MNRYLITRLSGRLFVCREDDGRITELIPQEDASGEEIGNIYIGRVKHIKKDLQAAFIEYEEGKMCFYPLSDYEKFRPFGMEGPLHENDEILIQIEKAALKMKSAAASSNLNFTGEYLVLMTGKKGLNFSSRIGDPEEKNRLRDILSEQQELCKEFGLILRTNAAYAPKEAILSELKELSERAREILSVWRMRKAGVCLWKPEPKLLREVFNNQLSEIQEIVTDEGPVFELLKEKREKLQKADPERRLPDIRYYEDSYPMVKLHRLETELERALMKRVWLKSGGFLIIEPTEALVCIDVNTGKSEGKKKDTELTFLKTNLEAAREIALQLKLRNLSGIIIIDFIDMKSEENRNLVIKTLKEALGTDPVKTVVIGFTRLGLLEMTRKKTSKPLHELIHNNICHE